MAWYALPGYPLQLAAHTLSLRAPTTPPYCYATLAYTTLLCISIALLTLKSIHILFTPRNAHTPQIQERTLLPLHGQKTTPVVEGHTSANINYTNHL